MVPAALRSNTSTPSRLRPTLEIIPDTRFIVFHGTEHEALPVKLTGIMRLTTPESMSIMKPKLRLEGKRKISWWYMGGVSTGEVSDRRTFWTQEQKLGSMESAHKIKAGTIEWPFEFELSPSMPESVEGLRGTFIVYHLHASVSRPGWNSKDLLAQEHIRIVRTLGPESMETTRSRANADIWANKIAYNISIATDAVVFGTSVTANVELSPIKKGLGMGKVELRLVETVVKRIQASEVPDSRGDRTKSEESEVSKVDMDFPLDSKVTFDDETVDNPMMGDEMYRFQATLPLPTSLNQCRQDVDSHQINITHRFKLMVSLHNPEGHVSQLVCRLPVKLFISPNLPVDESNQVCRTDGFAAEAINLSSTNAVAPPSYGRHQLDQLFNDIDPTGYMSRGPSNPPTPGLSRRTSIDENSILPLDSLVNDISRSLPNGTTDVSSSPSERYGVASPSILRSRLADLQSRSGSRRHGRPANNVSFSQSLPASGANTPGGEDFTSHLSSSADAHDPSTHDSPSASAGHSAPLSRQESPTNHFTEPASVSSSLQQTDYNMDDLTRVPSYGAALRNPGTITPFTDGPPSYIEAISRPPSPQGASGIQRPGAAHVRGGATRNDEAVNEGVASGRVGTAMTGRRSHRGSTSNEDDARLRFLRARN